MSAVFKVTYEGKEFNIEITRDGELVFLDYDIELDRLRSELGEEPTVAVRLANEWIEDPIEGVITKIKWNDTTAYRDLSHVVLDWAAHLLPIYENSFHDDASPRNAINTARKYINGKTSYVSLSNSRWSISDAADLRDRFPYPGSGRKSLMIDILDIVSDAVGMAAWASHLYMDVSEETLDADDDEFVDVDAFEALSLVQQKIVAVSNGLVETFRRYVMYRRYESDAQPREASIAGNLAELEEKKWQIRRFVEVMEAAQSGKNPPPVEEVKIQ